MIKKPLLLFLTLAALSCVGINHAAAGWGLYVNPDVGYRVQYPSDLFREVKPDDAHNGVILDARDQQAVLYVFGGHNEHHRSASELASDLATMDDIHRVTYTRVASTWFVLSGFLKRSEWVGRGIFYERIAVSPDGFKAGGISIGILRYATSHIRSSDWVDRAFAWVLTRCLDRCPALDRATDKVGRRV